MDMAGGDHWIVEHQRSDDIVTFSKKIIACSWPVYRDESEEQTNYCGLVCITKVSSY